MPKVWQFLCRFIAQQSYRLAHCPRCHTTNYPLRTGSILYCPECKFEWAVEFRRRRRA